MVDRFLFLYGPPGSGKSTLGHSLAESLGLPFYDLDALIAEQSGMEIPQIFAQEGESGFRRREKAALRQVLNTPPGVVALGGGALLDKENLSWVNSAGVVLCLQARLDTLLERIHGKEANRPLLAADLPNRLLHLLEQRHAHYAAFPLQLDTTHLTVEQSVYEAEMRLGWHRVGGMGSAYDVRIEQGSLPALGAMMQRRGLGGPVVVVTDQNVAAWHLAPTLESLRCAGYEVHDVIIPTGERSKTLATLAELWQAFSAVRLERRSTVVALGGGVVTDLAGFAAATFLRGIPWVAVPTSLLGMVDATLGGKTGADLPQGKNLIGAFHAPRLVLADPSVLRTLPEEEWRNGLAEVVKHGILADPTLFLLCSQGLEAVRANLDEVLRRAVAVKIRIIQQDPYEKGERALLNLGHTLGHALEAASEYRLRHGEAVAIGMAQAARLAERLGLAESGLSAQIVQALQALGLPSQIPPWMERERILAAMGIDKKRAQGELRLVLPRRVGEVLWGVRVERAAEQLLNA